NNLIPVQTVREHSGSVVSVSAVLLPGGQVGIASGSADAKVRWWQPGSPAPVQTMDEHRGLGRSVSVVQLAGGQVGIASGSDDGTVRWWMPGQYTVLLVDCRSPVLCVSAIPGWIAAGLQ